jgi:hypothetical protein
MHDPWLAYFRRTLQLFLTMNQKIKQQKHVTILIGCVQPAPQFLLETNLELQRKAEIKINQNKGMMLDVKKACHCSSSI